MSVPSELRSVLEPFIEDLKARETISGIGLFGSWGRGEAVSSSDVDLLIVEDEDFDYEYVERIELNGYLVDLNYIPKRWVAYRVPPEIDQKIYELKVLFDRDNLLERAKNLMFKVYWRPERVEIRTESHLVEADAYLSRARLAFNKEDYQSVKVNSVRAFRSLMKILTEIGRNPVLNSSFMRNLESSSEKLGMSDLYEEYVKLMGFTEIDKADVESMLNSLLSAWRGMISFIAANSDVAKTIHPRVSRWLKYYGRETFLKGLAARVKTLIEECKPIESAHYMLHTLADMLENYIFLVSRVESARFDYASILKCLRESRRSPTEVYQESLKVLGVEEVSSRMAEEALDTVTKTTINIREKRKDLIVRFIG